MKIVDNITKQKWDEFVSSQEHSQFLQSWEWGELIAGNKILRLGVVENEELVGAASIVKQSLPLGMGYYFAQRGPIFQLKIKNYELKITIANLLFEEISRIAKKNKIFFLRIEPGFEIQNSKFKIQKTIDLQPAKTIILDLQKSGEGLLGEMHPKTRYNIRLSEKKELEIKFGTAKNFEEYWALMKKTADRDGFRLHGKEHYQQILSSDNGFIKLILAYYQGKLIAGNILSFYGDTVTYVHGASANENRETMATYGLQWLAIKKAKEQGYKYYDLYGIDETKWPGVTRFKKGFGGQEIEYPGTYDVVFNENLYSIYKLARKLRRM